MAKKLMAWRTKGMNRDLSVSAFSPEFAFENVNLRLSTNDSNTQMSWVSERGTLPVTIYKENADGGIESETEYQLQGTVVGTAILNDQLILFVKAIDEYKKDFIYRLKYTNADKTAMQCKVLFENDLGFYKDNVTYVETLASYESENVQKVYWTDGVHQPRVMNINRNYLDKDSTVFDFVRTLQLKETVTVKKMTGSGMFAAGVIQYAFTYYDKYLQETNIFYTTPLCYISHLDRGAAPDQKVENAFKITVSNVDTNFDYLRIYSIQRTSVDGTPICKRVQDIYIQGLKTVSYIDTGYGGDTIDPTELLYKGGEVITASTIEQKDNTLFLGNIKTLETMNESTLDEIVKTAKENEGIITMDDNRTIVAPKTSSGDYDYCCQLNAYEDGGGSVPCGGFKNGDYYRLGVQFQHTTGKWSKPIFIEDYVATGKPSYTVSDSKCTLPIIQGYLLDTVSKDIMDLGYKKARAVVVFPQIQDRTTLCQGVVNPTLFTTKHRDTDKDLYAQSSWFFRPFYNGSAWVDDANPEQVQPSYANSLMYLNKSPVTALDKNSWGLKGYLAYTANGSYVIEDSVTKDIGCVEIQGGYNVENFFRIDSNCVTFHSPDVEFDTELSNLEFSSVSCRRVGHTTINKTFADIDIQTETPTISNAGAGFMHKSFISDGAKGIAAGRYYEDFIVDDLDDGTIQKYDKETNSVWWFVFPWHRTGSLNNDINRPADKGTRTAMLKKKVISNLRFGSTEWLPSADNKVLSALPQLFSSDEVNILKFNSLGVYQGNINTALVPDFSDGLYFASTLNLCEDIPGIAVNDWYTYKTYNWSTDSNLLYGVYKYGIKDGFWKWENNHIGNKYLDLVLDKSNVSMKYKSTPHLVFKADNLFNAATNNQLPIVEITQEVNKDTIFGGTSEDALRANTWLPCGKPVALSSVGTTFYWEYGDTYYQRWDCLKTYPFTREDINQIVEIGSFMLETRVNIDGRYDRNRGQLSNINMSPTNFNLLNMVYTQQDNFFSYKILPDDDYKVDSYPNQITWNLTKESGADVDLWTKVNMASVLEMDGDKGKINKLIKLGNQLFCFQDTGISQILYNESVQVTSTEGVPVEIANSGKVQGKRYISNVIGCSNKRSVAITPNGAYFIDNTDKSIYLFNGNELKNISASAGFNTWCKANIPSADVQQDSENLADFVTFYDKLNQDVLFVNKDTALAWSEKFGLFTSFYSYGNAPFFNTLLDTSLWVKGNALWKHQAGDICKFFGEHKPYSMTLVGNTESHTDKTFTNLEFRANVVGDGEIKQLGTDVFDDSFDETFHPEGWGKTYIFEFYTPFDSLEVWNEHQRGSMTFSYKNGRETMRHFLGDNTSHLARKFRMWRCDIPRNNYPLPETDEEKQAEESLGIYRHFRKPMDRMRNPWLYLKLTKNAIAEDEVDETKTLPKVEIHDLMMTYYD